MVVSTAARPAPEQSGLTTLQSPAGVVPVWFSKPSQSTAPAHPAGGGVVGGGVVGGGVVGGGVVGGGVVGGGVVGGGVVGGGVVGGTGVVVGGTGGWSAADRRCTPRR